MTFSHFESVLARLGYTRSKFCRELALGASTLSNWKKADEIPAYAIQYLYVKEQLALLSEERDQLKRLLARYLAH